MSAVRPSGGLVEVSLSRLVGTEGPSKLPLDRCPEGVDMGVLFGGEFSASSITSCSSSGIVFPPVFSPPQTCMQHAKKDSKTTAPPAKIA